jgi:hypothetical protein
VHTIVEDHRNPDLLFVGTEFGVFASLDGGEHWQRFMNGLPPVAVHDLIIHPRDNDLIAGTHGRSIWIVDDLAPLQAMAGQVPTAAEVFEGRAGTRWENHSKGRIQTHFKFRGRNPASGAVIRYWLPETPADSVVTVTITDPISGDQEIMRPRGFAGLNEVRWGMQFSPDSLQVDAWKQSLLKIAASVEDLVRTTRDTASLRAMRRDLMAPHRSPSPYDDVEYPSEGDREILLAHAEAITARIEEGEGVRVLGGAWSQLLAYSFLAGDRTFEGFFGAELNSREAPAGRYRVEIAAGTHRAAAWVTVREDPGPDE